MDRFLKQPLTLENEITRCSASGWIIRDDGQIYLGQDLIDRGFLEWGEPVVEDGAQLTYLDRMEDETDE